jgi:hypothetical protein
MFKNVTLSTTNYDNILNSWSQLTLQPNVTFHGGNSQYSTDTMANRQSIIDTFSWTITDGGLDASIEDITVIEDGSDFNVTLNLTDADYNIITYSATSLNTDMVRVSIVGNVLVITLVGNQYGTVTIEVYATVDGVTTLQTFTLTISAVNDAPIIETTFTDLVQVGDTNSTINFTVNDSEGDQLDINVSSSNTSVATVTATWVNSVSYAEYNNVLLTFTLDTQNVTTNENTTITLEVRDGEFTTSQSFDVSITPSTEETVNLVPIITYILL